MKSASLIFAIAAALVLMPARAADIARGESLYRTYCLPCHGFPPGGGAQFGANNAARIRAAIGGVVPAMTFMSTFVTSADIDDIAAYLGSVLAPGAATVTPAFDFSDLWWSPQESGWGLNLVQHASGNIFGVMYTYEAPNRPLWLVIPGGNWTSSLVFTGSIYRVTGPLASAFNPALVNVKPVGGATLTFSDRDHGVFTFTIDGAQVTKTITRQPF